jgi:thiol-disulfide isomerase/thioredoxin
MKNNIFDDDTNLNNDFNNKEFFNDNIDNLSTSFGELNQYSHSPYATSFDFEKSLQLTGKASTVNKIEVDSVETKTTLVNEVDATNDNKANLAGPAEVTVFGNSKMTVLPTKESNVGSGEAAGANSLTHKQPNLLTKQKDVFVGTTTQLDIEKASLTSQASSVTIAEEKANQLEAKLKATLNKLGDRKRKILGYSMITIGVVLSSVLLITTFARLEFKDVFLKSTSNSKDTLTKILAKTGTAKPNSNLDSNSNPNSSYDVDSKSILGTDNNSGIAGNNSANNNSNSNVVINLSDSRSHNGNGKSDLLGNEVLGDWQAITSLLASTPNRRKLAAKTLGVDKGEWVLACFSVGCGDCDRAAIKLNQLKANGNVGNVLAITTASLSEANLWKERLGLAFEVRSVSSQTFDDTGTVFLPTIIKLKNGVSIGAKESLGSN